MDHKSGHKFWFKPKTFGYGATPSGWEGWTVTAVYGLVILGCVVTMTMMAHRESFSTLVSLVAVSVVATIALIVVSIQKTDGTWGWNAGSKEIAGKN
jgi:hypothetical protein